MDSFLIQSTSEIITKIEISWKKRLKMFQNFGLPQSTAIGKFFGKIHFRNCYDQEVDKDLILKKFWFAWIHLYKKVFLQNTDSKSA